MVKQVYGAFRGRQQVRARPPLETESHQVWLEFQSVRQELPQRKQGPGAPGWLSVLKEEDLYDLKRNQSMAFCFKSLRALLGSQQPSPGTAYKQARMAV